GKTTTTSRAVERSPRTRISDAEVSSVGLSSQDRLDLSEGKSEAKDAEARDSAFETEQEAAFGEAYPRAPFGGAYPTTTFEASYPRAVAVAARRLLDLGGKEEIVALLDEALARIVEVTGASTAYLELYDDEANRPRFWKGYSCTGRDIASIRASI